MPRPRKKVVKEYTADDIITLSAMDHIRLKPGMYIRGTDEHGLHDLVDEVLGDFIDQFREGNGTRIRVMLGLDGSIAIQNNGCTVPLSANPVTGNPLLEEWLTSLYTGGIGHPRAGETRLRNAKTANALSEWFKVEVFRRSRVHTALFERGKV